MAVYMTLANAILAATMSEAILYGVYCVLFGIAMFLLITKRTRNKATSILMATNIAMFLLASAHMIMVIEYAFAQYLHNDAAHYGETILQRRGDPRVYVPTVLEIIDCFIGDAIVIWRAWVLWGKSTKALTIPGLLWLASVAQGIAVMQALAAEGPGEAASLGARQITSWTTAFAATTFFSNVWAVGMITYRYYVYHREVVAVLGARKASCRSVLALIIESGLLYCTTWIIFIAVYMSGSRGMYIVFHLLAQLTAIYPTMIIVLVCLRLTQQDEIESFYSSVRFRASTMMDSSGTNGREILRMSKSRQGVTGTHVTCHTANIQVFDLESGMKVEESDMESSVTA